MRMRVCGDGRQCEEATRRRQNSWAGTAVKEYPNFLRATHLMPVPNILSSCLNDICDLIHA